ncbi:RICIN domain-containing protein [Hymenobacter aerilatus]|uniref:RICIN domain-containing protein n=1 Tax=Hymenobacter aerilatus TaxID=2932251 RepID=A0A8T9SNY4_9BACT|nr:RICIN domain-containing protein [Hymenobacter aerilatus]UOR03838.1 RICIN domain-containing protein [Hymenobacter aerilatus]
MNSLLVRSLWLLLLVVGVGQSGWAQAPGIVPEEGAWYGIIARSSGRSLDIANSSAEAGAAAVQWEFNQARSQQWRFVPVMAGSQYYRIESRNSSLCLTLERPEEGAPIVQRPWTGSFYQQWALVPIGPIGTLQLVNRGNDKCAALAGADRFNATPVVGQAPQNRATQQWRLFKLQLNIDVTAPGFGPVRPIAAVNTPANELQPVPTPDGKRLYFARTKYAGNTEGNTESGDIWVSTSTNNGETWGPASRFEGLNTAQNNGVMSILNDGKALLVRGTYSRDNFRDEGVSRVVPGAKGKNGLPEPLPIRNYYSLSPANTFFMTPDEKVLLLSIERSDSQGSNDLYVSYSLADGTWSEPQTLGNVINSPGYDFAPWLSPDGKTLYFSSYGHAGFGGADIFASTRLDTLGWSSWSVPRNLGGSINGAGFDAYLSLSGDGKQAYFASAPKPDAPADLFRTITGVTQEPPAPDTTAKPVLARTMLTGKVLNTKTSQAVSAEVRAVRLGSDIVFNATGRTDAGTGFYQFSLPPGQYRLTATSTGFLTASDTVTVAGSMRRDLLLVPAAVGSKLELPTLIFSQGKFDLLPASYEELNRLARTLADNPAVSIQLEGHTDNVGNPQLNVQLSLERVQEVKRYLVSRGVAANRITTVGYGGAKPRASNAREETRRLNRRVEFTITKD